MIQTTFNGMIAVLMTKFMLNDVPHSLWAYEEGYLSPWVTVTTEAHDIISRSGLRLHTKPYIPPRPEEEEVKPRKRRVPVSRKVREVGTYSAVMDHWAGDTYSVKLYQNLPGWRKRLLATKTGLEYYEARSWFDKVVENTIQVQYEYRTALER